MRRNLNNIAPVALFCFKRLDTLILTLEALKKNLLADKSSLYIFSDDAKDSEDRPDVQKVRKYLKTITGFHDVKIIERASNFGLKRNIVEGVTDILDTNDSIIVLEDDILTSPYFLTFMNDALSIYRNNSSVCQVVGYSYLEGYTNKFDIKETYFLKGADCLAWGTWRRSWINYHDRSEELYKYVIRNKIRKDFDREGSYPFTNMLLWNAQGKTSSWAINWLAINFVSEKYTLYPLKSLALHIGIGPGSTNYDLISDFDPLAVVLSNEKVTIKPQAVIESNEVSKAYQLWLRTHLQVGLKRYLGVVFNKITKYRKWLRECILV